MSAIATSQRASKNAACRDASCKTEVPQVWLHKRSATFVKECGVIFIGKAIASRLAQRQLGKSVLDAGVRFEEANEARPIQSACATPAAR
ncbi:hypothetical protein PWR63_01655 [Paraburkholderia sp. A2WS-5]|uniref:hypothetical protein n=1 Tax=unclassified Paraburkholderia TaxID=2615204 RepID=UPI003B7B89DF